MYGKSLHVKIGATLLAIMSLASADTLACSLRLVSVEDPIRGVSPQKSADLPVGTKKT